MKITLFALLLCITSIAHGAWTPPEQPDPSKILQEAKADATAGHYEDALAKQVWFHQNALKHDQALTGVRLSFALSDWIQLGAAYPPALKKLTDIRDEAAANVRETENPDAAFKAFFDFESINKTLHEEDKTKELFVWMDATKPKLAPKVFRLAEPSLIEAKEYKLCGKYIDPKTSFKQIVRGYQTTKEIAKDPKAGTQLQEYNERSFSNGTATLVALLVLNDRKADADQIVVEAEKEWDDPAFKQQLEEAQKGNVPTPYP